MHASVPQLVLLSIAALNPGLPPPAPDIDRSTPTATVLGFLETSHDRRFLDAAHFLDLRHLPEAEQAEEGPRLARRLMFVVDRKLWFDFANISQDPAGDPADPRVDLLGIIPLGAREQPIQLRRVMLDDDRGVWVFSRGTVEAIDALYDAHAFRWSERLPDALFSRVWILELWQWVGLLIFVLGGWLFAFLVERLVLSVAGRATRMTKVTWDDRVVEAARRPLRYPVWATTLAFGARWLRFPPPAEAMVDVLARAFVIVAIAWFLLRLFRLLAEFVHANAAEAGGDPGKLRGLQTQLTVLRHVIDVVVVVVASALILMQFETVRNIGVSLLASAGVAGLVIGLAAQKSISTLLAGIQLSITQPVRIGDTVIVEGEWGWIEEVTLTYVVVKVWDLRRLVVPMTHLLERPFQNWSRNSTALLGTVIVHADYTCDLEAIRAELDRILENEGKELWDGAAKGVIILDTNDTTLTLRATISAADSGAQWNLRCLVREKLIAFLQQHPEWLPTRRAEVRTEIRQADGPAPTPRSNTSPAPGSQA